MQPSSILNDFRGRSNTQQSPKPLVANNALGAPHDSDTKRSAQAQSIATTRTPDLMTEARDTSAAQVSDIHRDPGDNEPSSSLRMLPNCVRAGPQGVPRLEGRESMLRIGNNENEEPSCPAERANMIQPDVSTHTTAERLRDLENRLAKLEETSAAVASLSVLLARLAFIERGHADVN